MNADPEVTTRDNLALVRTDLANERTLLAYGRTALMLGGTGVSLVKFLGDSPLLQTLGWILLVLGIIVGLIGAVRFTRLYHRMHPQHHQASSQQP